MKEVNKRTLVLSEVDRVSPEALAVAQGLTRQVQEAYSKDKPQLNRGGDIFMPTEGKHDMAANSQPTNLEHAEKARQASSLGEKKPVTGVKKSLSERQTDTRKYFEEVNKGKIISVDERRVQEELIRMGAVHVSGGSQENIDEASRRWENAARQGEARRRAEERIPPVPPGAPSEEPNNQLGPTDFNIAGVIDPGLRRIGERIGIRLARNLMDYREVENNIRDMESALSNLPAGSPDETWARNLYNKLYNEVLRQRQLAGEVNWEKVREDLMIATKAGDLKTIEDIVRKNYDFNERINVRDLVEVSLSDDAIKGGTYGYALEYVLESIVNVADLTPLGTIPNPTFAQSENISRLIKATLDLDQDTNKKFYKYLKDLQERRQLSHELYKSMSTRGAYEKYVGEHLKNDGFHYLENEIVGVSETQGLWEKVMARKKSEKKQILSQTEFDDIHEEVKRLFKKNTNLDAGGTSQKLKKRFTISKVDESGTTQSLDIERPLREWEIDRAAVVGRSVAHVSGRAITYGMLGDLPLIGDELFESMNAEYVARITGSMKVSAQRFIAQGSSASKKYVELWVKNKIEIAKENGLVFGEGEKGVYGQKLESSVYMDTGVPDLKSHGWRNRRTQLKNSVFAKIAEHDPDDISKNTIGDYLDREWDKVKDLEGKELDDVLDIIQRGPIPDRLTEEELAYLNSKDTIGISKSERVKSIKYSRNIKNIVLQQRLYLGTLLKELHFTPMLKEEIWKKTAEFLPSRIAAFFPEERKNISEIEVDGEKHEVSVNNEEWQNICDKLFMAEMDRTRKQKELVEVNDFREVELSEFYDANGITTKGEIAYIEAITQLGKNKSKMLSIMIFSQNAFLDDAPEPEWMNLGKETVGRLLVNDYEGYNTANNERNAVIGNPSMRTGESAEHLVKAKDGYASPIGTEGAQDRLEADVRTRYDLYSMDSFSKWGMYSINRALRYPTSLIEKSNVDANISMDEKAISQDVDFLSQHSVINNDRAKLDFLGYTQSERIKKKAKARLRNLWIRNLRLFLMLFPPAFSIEFIKMIAPEFKDK